VNRLKRILDLIEKILHEFRPTVSVVRHEVDSQAVTEYIYIRILFPKVNAVVTLREYWKSRKLIAYGYYVRVKAYEEWWDNRPHHPEVPTFPHHRHT